MPDELYACDRCGEPMRLEDVNTVDKLQLGRTVDIDLCKPCFDYYYEDGRIDSDMQLLKRGE